MRNINTGVRVLALLAMVSVFGACAATRTHESTGQYVDDAAITTRIKTSLAGDDFLKSFQISVKTYQGTVQLSGFVNSRQAADKAGEIASGTKGVKSLQNNLIVK